MHRVARERKLANQQLLGGGRLPVFSLQRSITQEITGSERDLRPYTLTNMEVRSVAGGRLLTTVLGRLCKQKAAGVDTTTNVFVRRTFRDGDADNFDMVLYPFASMCLAHYSPRGDGLPARQPTSTGAKGRRRSPTDRARGSDNHWTSGR